MTRVSFAIQTHPARAEMAEALLACLDGKAEMVVDPAPTARRSPWRTYREALERTPGWATHRLILQDDVLICDGFRHAATAACAARPDRAVAFFVPGRTINHRRAILHAHASGSAWAELDPRIWVPAVATAWPVGMVEPFLAWVDEQGFPDAMTADDEIIGRFMRHRVNDHGFPPAVATVPSLVEHPDTVPSLAGQRRADGSDPGRVAALWIGDVGPCDGRLISWA